MERTGTKDIMSEERQYQQAVPTVYRWDIKLTAHNADVRQNKL